MNLVEWFDIKNPDHINAFLYLRKRGTWPPGFLPLGVDFPVNWLFHLNEKMANEYLKIFNRGGIKK